MIATTPVDLTGLQQIHRTVLDRTPVSIGIRRTATPHEFYRYPARFAPALAAAVIQTFSEPGDTVADYFVGGGTTLVEARLAGRVGIGSDVNSLAAFVSRVKTRLYTPADLSAVGVWAEARARRPRGHRRWPIAAEVQGYFRNFDDPELVDQRAVILAALSDLQQLETTKGRDLARCILLRTSQWALDMRSEVPTAAELREALVSVAGQTIETARTATSLYRAADRKVPTIGLPRSLVLQRGVPGMADEALLANYATPRLVLTSPPYPGVYVNYHRWKIRGRLETPLPYFIAGQHDGQGLSHYTMSARVDRTSDKYFARLRTAYQDIARMCSPDTWLVQVVGFSDVDGQLPRYLRTMTAAGFTEVMFPQIATHSDSRLWRDVPGRRWWARAGDRSEVAAHTAREVVLFHRRSPDD